MQINSNLEDRTKRTKPGPKVIKKPITDGAVLILIPI